MLSIKCSKLANSRSFNHFIIATILLAAVVVGAQTYKTFAQVNADLLLFLDRSILTIFTLEALIKITAEGKRPLRYFKNPWNIFDFAIVAACHCRARHASWRRISPSLKAARILRVLRLITAIPKLQLLVTCLLKSLPSMFYVSILLFLLFYVYGAMAVFLFGDNDPVHFRNLQTSILSLFRVVTLEDWTDVMYINMYGSDNYGYSSDDLA